MNQEIQDLLLKLRSIKEEAEFLSLLPIRGATPYCLSRKEDIDKAFDALCGGKED